MPSSDDPVAWDLPGAAREHRLDGGVAFIEPDVVDDSAEVLFGRRIRSSYRTRCPIRPPGAAVIVEQSADGDLERGNVLLVGGDLVAAEAHMSALRVKRQDGTQDIAEIADKKKFPRFGIEIMKEGAQSAGEDFLAEIGGRRLALRRGELAVEAVGGVAAKIGGQAGKITLQIIRSAGVARTGGGE